MKIIKILNRICYPLIKLKQLLDWNHQASKIGENSLYDKALNSRTRKWANNLTGWKYWVYQIIGGIIFVIIIEYLLNMINMTILPWR